MIVFFSMFFLSSAKLFFFRMIVTRLNRFRSRNYSDNSGDGGGVNDNDGGNDDTVYRGSGADAQLIILISSITTPPAI